MSRTTLVGGPKTTPGQAQKHKKVSVFFCESVASQRPATPSKKHGLFCAFVLAPASFLTFGKVNPGPPPQTDIFFGRVGGVQNTTLLLPASLLGLHCLLVLCLAHQLSQRRICRGLKLCQSRTMSSIVRWR